MTRIARTNCPFTLDEYRSLVRLAARRFPLTGFAEYRALESFVIWRHDVEYSVPNMDMLAQIDAEEGARSTFFVQLHSEFYNFWDTETVGLVRGWIKQGHHIGLHFDCAYYGPDVFQRLEELVAFEKSLLERIYATEILSFSFHNPTPEILRCQDDVAGLVNAYNRDFQRGDIVYVSDSNGRWRERTIRDVLEDSQTTKAQINVHDTWWSSERIPQVNKLEKAFREAAEARIRRYRDNAIVVVEDVI